MISIDLFKARLDNFWSCQDVMFDWTADLAGIGDRPECVMLNVEYLSKKLYWRTDMDIEALCVCVCFIIDYYYHFYEKLTKCPKFYMIIGREIFSRFFFLGGGQVPLYLSHFL